MLQFGTVLRLRNVYRISTAKKSMLTQCNWTEGMHVLANHTLPRDVVQILCKSEAAYCIGL